MKQTLLAAIVAVGFAAIAPVHAATDAQKDAAVQKWQSMTPEEQAAAKAKAKAKYDSMTPEEQAAAKKKFAERHPQAAQKLEAKRAAASASAP
jgi:hypothetical protein